MHSEAFDVIPYEDIKGNWKKLGSGSFGNVWKGTYLGIDVAIKEVLPSTEYDVGKYFEREWRLMKECRHPNICLFIGLSRAPTPDNRIFIISEFIENGNVRMYIHDKTKPFPWRLRVSFATDVARALAYLHARRCIHRDLKGENLLVTANGRLKITDFGFARIAARNEEESKRLTFCGTDSYMSPEILLGDEFHLSTDIFSLGIIFCEIGSRTLAGDHHFKRHAPNFALDVEEMKDLIDPGCPEDFQQLCIDCCQTNPKNRPTTRDILERLRLIEAQVLARPSEGTDLHFGSIRFMAHGKRPNLATRIPSFGMGAGKEVKSGASSEDSDDELAEAVMSLSSIHVKSEWTDGSISNEPLLQRPENSTSSEYSTTVIKSSYHTVASPLSLSSILTVRPSPDRNGMPKGGGLATTDSEASSMKSASPSVISEDPLNSTSVMSISSLDSYHTAAASSSISSAYATEGGSTVQSLHGNFVTPLVHRFTLLKPGKQKRNSASMSPTSETGNTGWNPLDILFSSGLLTGKCDLCGKRIAWKPALECDDCGLRTHVKCGELAPMDCGLRPRRHLTSSSHIPLSFNAVSPLSKVKQGATQVQQELKSKNPTSPSRR